MLLLLLLSIVSASLNSVVLNKAKLNGNGTIFKFNLLCSAIWCVCLLIANGFRCYFDARILLWGCIYGVTQALFILFKTAAMNSGSVSITTLIGNCSLVVSVIVCLVLWNEAISIADIAGLALLMLGITLTTLKTTHGKFTKKWVVYVLLFLICGAGVGITFKAFSKAVSAEYAGDMMLVASVVMLLSYTIMCFLMGGFSPKTTESTGKRKFLFTIFALISGLLSCLYNRLNIYLSGALTGVIFFPAFNGGVIMLSTVLSIILLREKLSLKQILGILAGIIGICIIGIL